MSKLRRNGSQRQGCTLEGCAQAGTECGRFGGRLRLAQVVEARSRIRYAGIGTARFEQGPELSLCRLRQGSEGGGGVAPGGRARLPLVRGEGEARLPPGGIEIRRVAFRGSRCLLGRLQGTKRRARA